MLLLGPNPKRSLLELLIPPITATNLYLSVALNCAHFETTRFEKMSVAQKILTKYRKKITNNNVVIVQQQVTETA